MQKFVAIIGQRNSGKSTVIKSLTGCPTNGHRGFVDDEESGKSIYVVCGSPQEAPEDLQDIAELQRILDKVASRDGCSGIVMAIQPSRPSVRLSMEDILSEVQLRKFKIHAYVLDPGRASNSVPLVDVNQRLQGLAIVAEPLDGRRFSHLNASIINAATQIAS